jgi:hypothetical protein
MANDGYHARVVVEHLGDPHGPVVIRAVVQRPKLQEAPADPTACVDLVHGELRAPLHGNAAGLRDGPSETDLDGPPLTGARRERKRGADEGNDAARRHDGGRVRGKVKAGGTDLQHCPPLKHGTGNGLAGETGIAHTISTRFSRPVWTTPPPSPSDQSCVVSQGMDVLQQVCRFAGALEGLLGARDPAAFEAAWKIEDLDRLSWDALALARRSDLVRLARPLAALDRRLIALLERSRAFFEPHLVTFRVPEIERWQHAAAAALVGARWGVAGLRTVVADVSAPRARRYFAFLGLADRHPAGAWPLFECYLTTPGAHHAFVGAAVDAARYYDRSAALLMQLFERIRGDEMLRRFLGPKILESLYVLRDPASLPFFEGLLVAGHTDADVDCCEVTRALVAVRIMTGRVAPSAKFSDEDAPQVRHTLDEAERRFETARDRILPVTVI